MNVADIMWTHFMQLIYCEIGAFSEKAVNKFR